MSSTINYYEDIIECSECGTENQVNCISESTTQDNETFNEVVAGQYCKECGAELKFE